MKILCETGDICPICYRMITGNNCWVRFHVKYKPEMVVLACKYCNFIELCLRLRLPVPFSKRSPYNPLRKSRAERVVDYMARFGVEY